ncbi:hypothetical protein CCR75_008202 [Bremia lactucae]|uniref:Uncharacterized protein n=1 Tax=Bremia lactucae TaxID=4779 RepID=A0A976FJ48_BRELC|nr:hypothetical protein CCR75_008202 [Bremia lactucae]
MRAAVVPRGDGFGLRSRVDTGTHERQDAVFREEPCRNRGEIDLVKYTAKGIYIMPHDSVFYGSQAIRGEWRFVAKGVASCSVRK